jgi:hypothetical protein
MLVEMRVTEENSKYSDRCFPQDDGKWRGSRVRSVDCVDFNRLTCCCVC